MFLRGGYSLLEGVRLYPSEAVRHEYRTFQRRVADQDIDVEAVAGARGSRQAVRVHGA